MSWYELYLEDLKKKENVINYINDKISYKKNFINLIKKYSTNHKIIETGSGTGVISTYLASIGFDTTAIDIDPQMLELANHIAKMYNHDNKAKFVKDSIFELNYKDEEFDVSFSNGVLEHFNDEEIIDTLKKQMRIAKYVVFGIPTKYFRKEEAMYGDERYLPLSKWRKLIKASGGKILEESSMGYSGAKSRILSVKKWFKPKPFRIFVVRKDN